MRWLFLSALTVMLSGCALPPALTLASLVADLASYASTGKSVTDHGISLVLQRDCALLRGLGGEICVEPDPLQTAKEIQARNIRYEYPDDANQPMLARAPADPAAELAASLSFATDPATGSEITPRSAGRASSVRGLEELSYLGDSLVREG